MLKFSNLKKKIDVFTISKKVIKSKNCTKKRKRKFFTLLILILFFGMNICSIGQELIRMQGANLKWGFIDKQSNDIVIPFIYNSAGNFFEDLAAVKQGNKWGFIDKSGKVVIPFKYRNARSFSEGLAAVKNSNYWGFVDKTGKEVIKCKYAKVDDFKEDLAAVRQDNKWGFIDKTGKEVIPLKYTYYEAESLATKYRLKEERERIEELKKNSFKIFADNYIGGKISEWQKQGEFEKNADWQQRVNENTKKVKEAELLKEAEQVFIDERSKNLPVGIITLGRYNPDTEVFIIHNSEHGDWLEPVPIKEAPKFRENWNNIIKTPQFAIINDQIAFAGYKFGKQIQTNIPTVKSTEKVSQDDKQKTARESSDVLVVSANNQSINNKNISTNQDEIIINKTQIADTPQTASYDIILLKNGQEIKAKINEITLTEIKYKAFENLAGPTRYAAKNDVIAVIYANGQREEFGVAQANKTESAIPRKKITFGLQTGCNLAKMNSPEILEMFSIYENYSVKFKPGLNFGAIVEFPIKNSNFSIQTGILFSQLGSIWEASESKKTEYVSRYYECKSVITMNYIQNPCNFRLNIDDVFILQAGPYIGLGFILKEKWTSSLSIPEINFLEKEKSNESVEHSHFDIGFSFGAGFNIKNKVQTLAGYNHGFTNVFPEGKSNNLNFSFSLIYLF